jgi:hypothetical protein
VSKSYEYDAAISFLAKDEPLARQIAEALVPLNVFVYSKEQEKVAGSDGTDTFRDVFRNRTNIALVLFRAPWGERGWTQVEAIAIKEHCLEDGWEHLFFVVLDKHGAMPKWVPQPHIYLDFTTFTLADLVGAVKEKLVRLGGVLKAPSPLEIAKQLAAKEAFGAETKQLLRNSPKPFHEAARELFDELANQLDEIAAQTKWMMSRGETHPREFVAFVKSVTLTLVAEELFANSADGAFFDVRLHTGRLLTPQERGRFVDWGEHTRLGSRSFQIARLPETGWCWREGANILTGKAAAASLLEWQLARLR